MCFVLMPCGATLSAARICYAGEHQLSPVEHARSAALAIHGCCASGIYVDGCTAIHAAPRKRSATCTVTAERLRLRRRWAASSSERTPSTRSRLTGATTRRARPTISR